MTDPSPNRPRRAFVILNPVAGQSVVEAVRTALAESFDGDREAAAGIAGESLCTIHETTADEDLAALVKSTAEQGGYDMIVAAGGDGTVSAVADALTGQETPLGILPLGTANVLARELGIPVDLAEACQLLVGAHDLKSIDAMKVKDRYYLTQVGIGIDSMMIRDTDRASKRRFGRVAYLWTAFTRLIGFEPQQFTIECDGQVVRSRASQVVVANSGILGQPPFRWGPDIAIDDGRIDVCIVRAHTLLAYVSLARMVIQGHRERSQKVRYLKVEKRVVIATKRALPVQADGEIIGETPVEVAVTPRALRVVVPIAAESPEANHA